jgi:hypothetical protein
MTDESFQYGQVERALAAVHRIDASGIKALRALLDNIRDAGLAVDNPGKGKRIDYAFGDVVRFGCALELLQVGIAPRVSVEIVVAAGDALKREVAKAAKIGPRYMIVRPRAVSGRLAHEPSADVDFIGADGLAKLFASDAKRHERRTLIVNLTALYHELVRALAPGEVVKFAPASGEAARRAASGAR